MEMKVSRKVLARCAKTIAAVAVAGLLASCSGDGGTGGVGVNGAGSGDGSGTPGHGQTGETASGYATGTNIALPLQPAQITWLHSGTEEPQRSYWAQVAADFEAQHPGVEVTVTAVDSQELRGNALTQAISAGQAPDLFQSWGGGQLTEWVNRGYARDLSEVMTPSLNSLSSGAATNWEVDGHAFGLPYAVGPAGFWVNLNLLNDAGLVTGATIDETGNVVSGTVDWPTDLAGLYAMWDTLADHGITPVAVAGGSGWAGPWWYFALITELCSADAISAAAELRDFSDSCWEEAGSTLKQLVSTGAFNTDWSTTPAQGDASSAAGQVVLGNAAMEFQGPWGRTVMANILQTETGDAARDANFIAWFPFPNRDGAGHGNIMAAGDGFSVIDPELSSQAQSDAAAALLGFILSEQVQAEGLNFNWHGRNVVALPGVPTNAAAAGQITDPVLAKQAQAVSAAAAQIPWLDVYLGTTVGSAMNNSINSLMRGQISAADAIANIRTAAGNIG